MFIGSEFVIKYELISIKYCTGHRGHREMKYGLVVFGRIFPLDRCPVKVTHFSMCPLNSSLIYSTILDFYFQYCVYEQYLLYCSSLFIIHILQLYPSCVINYDS